MRNMKRGEKHKCVPVSTVGRVSAPCPAVQGVVWDFSREGARPGPGPRSSRHPTPHPSLLQGTAKAKPSSGQDYVYWVDPWRETARYRPGVAERSRGREGVERGPSGNFLSAFGQTVTIILSFLSNSNNRVRQRAEGLGGTMALLWSPYPSPYQGGVADLSGQPSQERSSHQQPLPNPKELRRR